MGTLHYGDKLKPLKLIWLALFWCSLNALAADTSQTAVKTWDGATIPEGVVWKGSETGLATGLKLSDTKIGEAPKFNVFLKNDGTNVIGGLIRGPAGFILELNRKFYAIQKEDGCASFMPPGRIYGPLNVDTATFCELPDSAGPRQTDSNDSHPHLAKGKNTVRLYCKILWDNNEILVPSAELALQE